MQLTLPCFANLTLFYIGPSEAGMGTDYPQVPGPNAGSGQGEPERRLCRGAGLRGPQSSALPGGTADSGLLPQLCQGLPPHLAFVTGLGFPYVLLMACVVGIC